MATDTPGRHGAAVRIRLQVLEGRVSQSAAAGLAGGRSSANRPDGSRPAAPSDAGWEPGVRLEPVPIAALLLERDRPGRSTIQEASMTTTRTRRPFLACNLTVAAAHAAGALITAAELPPQSARAQDGGAEPTPQATTADEDGAGSSWCTRIPPGYGHPPVNATPLTLQLLQRSVEPVPATDGLIHLPYVAQVTNTQPTPYDIVGVVPVDPLAGFVPTGRNLIIDEQGNDVAGKVAPFLTLPGGAPPSGDGAAGEAAPPAGTFSSRVPARNAGLMYFDVTYTDPVHIPRLLAHAITLATPSGGPGTPALTNPLPVGCKQLAVLHPPLVGHGWGAFSGCCTVAAYHRDQVLPVNGLLQAGSSSPSTISSSGGTTPAATCGLRSQASGGA